MEVKKYAILSYTLREVDICFRDTIIKLGPLSITDFATKGPIRKIIFKDGTVLYFDREDSWIMNHGKGKRDVEMIRDWKFEAALDKILELYNKEKEDGTI